MCGICGILNFKRKPFIAPERMLAMANAMAHRGPDDSGIHIGKECGLGHRRLSIIDISGGRQPMSIGEQGDIITLVYNGEIYNYLSLRKELIHLGHQFETESDTEVLLHAYQEWGAACVNRLEGMFAFAIWSERRKSLFLARDRMGIKPLYYFENNQYFVFASEIKAILASNTYKADVQHSALDAYLSLGYVPAPKTLFKGISKLLPGHSMTVDSNGRIKIECYWNFNQIESSSIPFSEARNQLEHLLKESVKARLMSEVPLGIFLSGGLDSSSITAFMSRITNQRIKTFTLGYKGAEEANELDFARKVADLFRTEHHEFILEPMDFMDSIPELVTNTEEPLADTVAIPLYQIAKEAKQYVTVLLSGEGSDELFCGYALYEKMLTMNRIWGLFKFLNLIPDSCFPGDKFKKYADWLSSPFVESYRSTSGYLTERIKRNFYSEDLLNCNKSSNYMNKIFCRLFKDVEGKSPLSQLLYVDSKTWLVEDLLLKADKMTMATSVELRVPFLDHKIVEFSASLPAWHKLNNGTGKYMLKKMMEKYLPKEIIYRKKMGFSAPTKRWFAGDLQGPARDIVFSKKLIDTGWFQKRYLESMFDRHFKGKEDYSVRIFSLLVLHQWLDTYLQRER